MPPKILPPSELTWVNICRPIKNEMPARPRVTIRCKGLAVTFEIALVLRKVKSTAIRPAINMIAIRNETSRASDFMEFILVCWTSN